ncbi:hypothetical protein DHW03_07415 [Pedobacter yonginense]|uniref:Uncharacterized protein n=1 Tax=Pedobacter yonginense TaxID=651869 RepID=A0A317EKR1_9SPHI|nr:hypothetical protein [Pedobacter yonginense]PWS27430.1 hypothetical protein DHW03_07415 [Pedobacter yonginense]
MNKLCYYIVTLVIALSIGCNINRDHLSVSTMDSPSKLIFKADYPKEKTGKLEKYLDSVLHTNLPLNENLDLLINLDGADKFNLKASSGHLEIALNKAGSSDKNYLKVKRLTESICNLLTKN